MFLWRVLGFGLGILVASGKVPVITGVFDDVVTVAVASMDASVKALVTWLAKSTLSSTSVEIFRALLTAAAPGMVALGLVFAARASIQARRVLTTLLLAAAISGFFVLPWQHALPAFVLIGAVAALTWFAVGPLAVTGLVTAATILGVRHLWMLYGGDYPGLENDVTVVSKVISTDGVVEEAVRWMLLGTAALPFAVALAVLFGIHRSHSHVHEEPVPAL